MGNIHNTTLNQIRRSMHISGSPCEEDEIPIKDQIAIFKQKCTENKPFFDKKQEWILEK